MEFTYCPQCGGLLGERELGDEGAVPYCTACERPFFAFSYPCVLVVVLNEDGEVVLLKQDYLSTTHNVMVAGYMKPGESAEEAAVREVAEETGQVVDECRYVASYPHPTRDILILGMLARVRRLPFNSSPEVDEIAWCALRNAPERLRAGSTGRLLLEAVGALIADPEQPQVDADPSVGY
jgi:NAD+ diphosphatase